MILISAFTSIKDIGKDFKSSAFVEEIFNSYKYITKIQSYALLIHGEKDSLIDYKHSKYLYQAIKKTNKYVDIKLNPNMTHNEFNLKSDIIIPIKKFLENYGLESKKIDTNLSKDDLKDIYTIPNSIMKLIEMNLFDIRKNY